MPTCWRSLRRSVAGSLTTVSPTVMRPPWIGSSALMQRNIVLLPEPDRPITATMSPGLTSSDTSSSTVSSPKRLVTCSILMSDIQPPLQTLAPLRQRKADEKIEQRHDSINQERSEGSTGGDLALARQFDEADHRGERRVLDQLHQEADRRRDRDAEGLGHDHVTELLAEAEPQRRRRLPLLARHRFDA